MDDGTSMVPRQTMSPLPGSGRAGAVLAEPKAREACRCPPPVIRPAVGTEPRPSAKDRARLAPPVAAGRLSPGYGHVIVR